MVTLGFFSCLFLAFLAIVESTKLSRRLLDPVARFEKTKIPISNADGILYHYVTAFYKGMPVDHLWGKTQDTFDMKYLYNLTFYKQGGPVFFYTGNEGYIESFAQNTGIMWDLAQTFNAAVVFAEHRFYGDSYPYGNLSYSDVKYLQFLSVSQVLADYATFIPWFKANIVKCDPNTPAVSFGGSYGGMLSAWFRVAYPSVTAGAWASSAPVLYFHDAGVPVDLFSKITSQTFVWSGCNFNAVVNGFKAIYNLAQSALGRKILNKIFKMASYSQMTSPDQYGDLWYYIQNAFDYMAMTDYPYPSDFLEPMPGWPIELACKGLSSDSGSDEDRATAMYNAANVYYNGTGTLNNTCIWNRVEFRDF